MVLRPKGGAKPDIEKAGVHAPSEEEEREFNMNLAAARVEEAKTPDHRYLEDGRRVIWAPQNGSQRDFMDCPLFEALFHGTRGPGKTDTLLMAFAQHVGKGHGAAWAGIIFRQTYPQLADIVAKSEKWFRQLFPGAKFNRSTMTWTFPDGERLLLRHMNSVSDYWNYHGHEYPFIGWEEISNYATSDCYKQMISCCRCSTQGVPRMIRATTNPYGPGHNWIKERFGLTGKWWETIIITDSTDALGNLEPPRTAIHGHIDENRILLDADPNYKQTIIASAANKAMAHAWLSGDWNIVAGGMFDDVWNPKYNVVHPFDIPKSWRIDRSFDWGSSAPFSVGWWAESDGSDIKINGKWYSTVRGDLFRIYEWYGWTKKPNEGLRMLAVDIAKGIVERELAWGIHGHVQPGPADTSIFDLENGVQIAADMAKPVRIGTKMYPGVEWTRADKRDGSVVGGCEMMRKMMRAAWRTRDGRPREKPGLFVFSNCKEGFIRTVPSIARDEKNLDRPHKDAEDHCCDEVRYRVRAVGNVASEGKHVGMV